MSRHLQKSKSRATLRRLSSTISRRLDFETLKKQTVKKSSKANFFRYYEQVVIDSFINPNNTNC